MSEKALNKDSWIETREYPSSHFQPMFSAGLLFLSLTLFVLLSTGTVVESAAFFLIFAILTFSVAIFPQYFEFKKMSDSLSTSYLVTARQVKGNAQIIPLVILLLVLLIIPIILVFIAPPLIFWGSIMGIVAGFASFQIVFIFFVRNWAKSRGLKVVRYSRVSINEEGKRVILEYGLKAVRD